VRRICVPPTSAVLRTGVGLVLFAPGFAHVRCLV
jgi:hypothetical protein